MYICAHVHVYTYMQAGICTPTHTHITVHLHTRSTLMLILSPFSCKNLGHAESQQLAPGHAASWCSGRAGNQTGWLQNSSPAVLAAHYHREPERLRPGETGGHHRGKCLAPRGHWVSDVCQAFLPPLSMHVVSPAESGVGFSFH